MDLTVAMHIITVEVEKALIGMRPSENLNEIKLALEEVERAVSKLSKIEKAYDKHCPEKLEPTPPFTSESTVFSTGHEGMSSFVIEDDNVRSES
jgi:hypothetical protein